MLRIFSIISGVIVAAGLTGCSAGRALVMEAPSRRHTPAEQLASVAAAYEARGDYLSAAEVYGQALEMSPGDRKLERQLSDVQRRARSFEATGDRTGLARRESPDRSVVRRAPEPVVRRESEVRQESLAGREPVGETRGRIRAASSGSPSRLRQLSGTRTVESIREPENWHGDDSGLDGFTDEELLGMETPLR